MNTKTINPQMLTVARESRDLNQSELAQAIGVTQGKISKYENGMLPVSEEDLAKISRVLRYTPDFFIQSDRVFGPGVSFIFRRRQDVGVNQLKQLQSEMNILRMQVERLLRGAEVPTDNRIGRMDIDKFDGNAEEVARRVRAAWGVPAGPILNLTDLIERCGGIVMRCAFSTRQVDAAHVWIPDMPPMFFINADAPTDRYRFNLAHELGHAVMHEFPTGDVEEEANRFASEFLMPERDIGSQLHDISLQKAAMLKPMWRVSMAALIRRSHDLGKISDRHYRSLFTRLSALGYRTNEPIPLPSEEPTIVRELLNVHRTQLGYSAEELAKLLFSTDPHLFGGQVQEAPIRLAGAATPFLILNHQTPDTTTYDAKEAQ